MEIKLSQAIIIQAAFDILAETQALSQLSMRNIANRIHVQAPALYWYFKNKQQLLQKMAETMEEELALPDPTLPWNEQWCSIWKITMTFIHVSLVGQN